LWIGIKNILKLTKAVSFIVCSNGYGHIKRVLLVIDELLKLSDSIKVNLFCKEDQINFSKNECNFQNSEKIKYISNVSINEISWIHKEKITLSQYKKWKVELEENVILINSALIVSDNHVLPLRVFKKSLLMCSFLWHDATLISNAEIEHIKKEELEFLRSAKPEIICVGDMVMDGVVANTKPIKVGWFAKRVVINNDVLSNQVLVTGGGTELINKTLIAIVKILSEINSEFQYFLDQKLYNICDFKGNKNIHQFSFSEVDFSNLRAIICRPGLGILTDSVKYSVPCLVVNDGYNKEINHNAFKVRLLEIGEYFNSLEIASELIAIEIFKLLINDLKLTEFKQKLMRLQTNGAAAAAQYLLYKIDNE
jgi:hypothetical protein